MMNEWELYAARKRSPTGALYTGRDSFVEVFETLYGTISKKGQDELQQNGWVIQAFVGHVLVENNSMCLPASESKNTHELDFSQPVDTILFKKKKLQ